MTKEQKQAIECLKADIKYWENTSVSVDHLEMAIKSLEQQPSEDCVDINHVIATISQHHFDKDKDNFDLLIHNLCKEINELPPVTPTYGTCKDCKQLGVMDCGYYCKLNHWGKISTESNYGGMGDFYCADFEKRGSK